VVCIHYYFEEGEETGVPRENPRRLALIIILLIIKSARKLELIEMFAFDAPSPSELFQSQPHT